LIELKSFKEETAVAVDLLKLMFTLVKRSVDKLSQELKMESGTPWNAKNQFSEARSDWLQHGTLTFIFQELKFGLEKKEKLRMMKNKSKNTMFQLTLKEV